MTRAIERKLPWWVVLLVGVACVVIGGVLTAEPFKSLSVLQWLVAAGLLVAALATGDGALATLLGAAALVTAGVAWFESGPNSTRELAVIATLGSAAAAGRVRDGVTSNVPLSAAIGVAAVSTVVGVSVAISLNQGGSVDIAEAPKGPVASSSTTPGATDPTEGNDPTRRTRADAGDTDPSGIPDTTRLTSSAVDATRTS